MIDLIGKVALITGGSRGIGAATAHLLAQAGADISITYARDKKAAEKVRQEVKSFGPDCLIVRADAATAGDVRSAVTKTHKTFGTIDLLVNNAGIWTYGQIGKMTERQRDEPRD